MEKVDISKLKQDYPLLREWEDHYAYELYKQIESQQLITEFLSTIDSSKTVKQLEKQFGSKVKVLQAGESIDISFTGELTREFLNKVNSFMDKFGWYPSFVGLYTKNAGKYFTHIKYFWTRRDAVIHYEAKYDKEVTVDSRYLYHLTPDTKWKSIKHIGLTPKTQGKLANHPGRIYLLTSLDGVDVEKLAFSLLVTYSQAHLVKEMYLLKVDTANLRDIKFFEDPNFFRVQAVWTYQNIPPTAISVVETFKY